MNEVLHMVIRLL